jgi:AraC-like DNA-binding protein
MIYQKFHPCKQLEVLVECYYIWESGSEPVANLIIESPPNSFGAIVFNAGDPYILQNKKYNRLVVPSEFVAGLSIYSYKLFLNGNISIAGIVFKPAGLATLLGLPVYDLTEERVNLKTILNPALVEAYAAALKPAMEPNEKAKLLEKFVMDIYSANKPVPDYIDEVANRIVESNGMLNVNDMLESVYMSRRNFERRFFKKVGLSPKYYARIRRISYLLNLIAGKKKADWVQLFNDCAFFIEFTGRSPQQYLEENQELANLIEKPTERPLQ